MPAVKTKQKSIIGLKELRENVDEYITMVGKGMTFTVVRRSRPVFNITPVDSEDDGVWETVIDFTKFKRGGIDIKELIKRLK